MNEARSAEYIQIYDSVVIEFFLRLKAAPWDDINSFLVL